MKAYIIGSGGFAKEVLRLLFDIHGIYDFKGFIDYEPQLKNIFADGQEWPVLDESEFLRDNNPVSEDIALFLGIGDPKKNSEIIDKYNGFNFPNLIHPTFTGSSKSIKIGNGNIITAGCVFTVDIKIGSYNIFNLSSTVGHDSVIGNFNVINPGVNISGGVIIGDRNLLGVNSTVLQYLNIGDNSILGAGAVLTKDLLSNALAVGIPAKVLKQL
ncbi:acetyltransferase [uncultured Pontibacter sp.]|uniref:acetyltransferase n=1 Tax=uncultured Pontibacter sp. TaxID=453356 RepID=UPI0026190FAE|nr:acetyltransferase [uncultured Pontibacter sp.]